MLKDLENWNKIPTETYKEIYAEAKVRYDELMSQSQNVTDKMIRMIIVTAALAAWNAMLNLLKTILIT